MQDVADNAAWDQWVSIYPNMNEENFIPFGKFKDKQQEPSGITTDKTLEEIEEEMLKVVAAYENGVKKE